MGSAFTSRRGAIMTTGAGTGHPGMIKVYCGPVCINVATITLSRSLNMSGAFTSRRGAIMTTGTGTSNSGMIE